MKKLIPALCMLLVAACLMGTSTYAWFSANKQVSATGMKVKAASDGGLAIASYTDDGQGTISAPDPSAFASSAALKDGDYVRGTDPISPVSYNNGKYGSGKWFTAEADKAEDGAATKGWADVTSTLDAYAHQTRWQVKSLQDGYTVPVTVTEVTVSGVNKSAALDKSIRVAIVTDEAAFIFAPVHEKNAGAQEAALHYVTAINATSNGFETGTDNLLRGSNTYNGEAVIFTALGTTAEDVHVFVYYEGEDPACKSANATNIDELTVTFKFNAGTAVAAN